MDPASPPTPLLQAQGIGVRYGATRALESVDVDVPPGQVHAVVGENGAGKSTLLKVLVGLVRICAGELRVLDHPRPPADPAEAERWGVGFAPQEIEVVGELCVAEQVTLGREPSRRLGWIDRAAQTERSRRLLARAGAALDPEAPVRRLGASERKLVQIARALAGEPRLLLLDEPTAALDAGGARAIGRLLREHAAGGGAAVLVSHRIDEVLALADFVTVLRDGRRVSSGPAADLDADEIVRRMVGREIPPRRERATVSAAGAEVALDWRGRVPLRIRRGEIVGLAGLVGAGRSEALEEIARSHPNETALVPEDRAHKGLIPTLGVRENLYLPAQRRWIRPGPERRDAAGWLGRLAIKARGPDAPIQALSGGNQQKVLLARALARRPAVVLLDEPTQGVDVAAKAEIHEQIRALAESGRAVVMASSDLPELLQLADRLVVVRGGEAVGELDAAGATEADVVALAAGVGGP